MSTLISCSCGPSVALERIVHFMINPPVHQLPRRVFVFTGAWTYEISRGVLISDSHNLLIRQLSLITSNQILCPSLECMPHCLTWFQRQVTSTVHCIGRCWEVVLSLAVTLPYMYLSKCCHQILTATRGLFSPIPVGVFAVNIS